MIKQVSHDSLPPSLIKGAALGASPACYLIEEMLSGMASDSCALVYADIDHFRAINSTTGYRQGDAIIERVMALIEQCMPDTIGIYRLGSGFFIILPETVRTTIESQCLQINKSLLNDSLAEQSNVIVSVTFGVSWHYAGADPAVALAEAEDICRQHKEVSPGGVSVFTEKHDNNNQLSEHMVILRALHEALNSGRMTLFAQPIGLVKDKLNDLKSPNTRYEVLVRMKNTDGVIVPPDEFLPTAERYSLISDIDRWVINSVLDYMATHDEKVEGVESYAINISGKSINDPAFIDFIINALESASAPDKICFEITETALVSNIDAAKMFVDTVGRFGSKVALDDFGTGMCSFGYLKHINVDYVKIDGSFIRSITSSSTDLAMVKAITDIGHVLGKRVVGEYVTDHTTLSLLGAIGVDYAQGYYVGRPIPLR